MHSIAESVFFQSQPRKCEWRYIYAISGRNVA